MKSTGFIDFAALNYFFARQLFRETNQVVVRKFNVDNHEALFWGLEVNSQSKLLTLVLSAKLGFGHRGEVLNGLTAGQQDPNTGFDHVVATKAIKRAVQQFC